MSARTGRRRAGLLIPLFSCPSSTSWGIGDIGDIRPTTNWLRQAGLRVLQLLPLNEMASGHQSPYSAISAMAIDPIFICVPEVPEFAAAGGEAMFATTDRELLDRARLAATVDFAAVRHVKQRALGAAFEWFDGHEWCRDTERARQLRAYLEQESWWLDDYALFRALRERERHRPWTEWPEALRRRDPEALAETRVTLAREILYYQYLQWLADTQWRAARAAATANGVALFGDLPFMVDGDSADVWARQGEFRLDASVGVPPDAFSATGQDWGMPPYRWDVIARGGFEWLRHRARRSAALFDGYRVDHLVGFYRTYARPRVGDGAAWFSPADEAEQLALGERTLGIFRDPGAEIIAEDLGTVPDFVRASLAQLDVPGFRVFRWERDWEAPAHPFRDPADYPEISVATSGTHDTEPMIVWWENATAAERAAVSAIPSIRALAGEHLEERPYMPAVRDTLLEALYAANSELLLIVVQDIFGWSERINEPATVNDGNWTFRLPWPIDAAGERPDVLERTQTLRLWSEQSGRAEFEAQTETRFLTVTNLRETAADSST